MAMKTTKGEWSSDQVAKWPSGRMLDCSITRSLPLILFAFLSVFAQSRVGQPGEQIATSYYAAVITASGNLDFYSRTGVKLIGGLPAFRARYSCSGDYLSLIGDDPVPAIVTDAGDSVVVQSEQRPGPVSVGIRYALCRSSPMVECRVRLIYEQAVDSVFREALDFEVWAESAQITKRDQQFTKLDKRRPEAVMDRWTTRAARFGLGLNTVCFPGEDNLPALRVQWEASHWRISYDLDRDNEHWSFRNYRPGRRVGYDTASAGGRRAGASRESYFRFAVGRNLRILKKERQPNGFEATLVMTEHADDEGPATTRAIAFGRSDCDTPIPGRGILGNGLTWTKSVYRWSTTGSRYANLGYSALDDPDFKSVIDNLHARGVEIGLHSPTALPDSVSRVATALRDLANWYGSRVWIDHGMDVNNEALARFGASPESLAWYIVDTLRACGFTYAWLAIDAPIFMPTGDNNLYVPAASDFYPLVLWPLPEHEPDSQRTALYLWATCAVNDNSQRNALFGVSALDNLQAKRGATILHLYFGSQDTFIGRPSPTSATWLTSHGTLPNLTWETDTAVDRCFQDLAERERAGRLRVATLSEFADYLLLSDSIELRTIESNEYLLVNHAHRPVPGFALSTPADGVRAITVDGREVTNQKKLKKDLLFWFDVPPDTSLRIRIDAPEYQYVQSVPVLGVRGCEIYWQTARAGPISLRIYSPAGRLIRTLHQGWSPAGTSSLHWDGRDARGTYVSAGGYIAHLKSIDGFAATRVIALIRP
jgi:hypothetical protein